MPYKFDLADVKGQLRPRRALEIAAAGDTPCSLKDHQAQVKLYWLHACLPFYRHFLLKKLLKLQVFILFQIHHILLAASISRAPPYSISNCTGWGGSHPKPGEITLSHLGVLFLDELP